MSARVRAFLALAATLACGLVAGVALGRTWLAPRPPAAMTEESLLAAMARDVGLDADQVKAVRAVLDRHQRTVDSAWQAVRPNVHAAIMASQAEIVAILHPEQRERYARWLRNAHGSMPAASSSTGGCVKYVTAQISAGVAARHSQLATSPAAWRFPSPGVSPRCRE